MTSRYYLFAISFLGLSTFCFSFRPALAAPPPVVAVFGIEDARPAKAKLSESDLSNLTVYLATKLSASGAYKIVPDAVMRAAIAEKKKESFDPCFDSSCQIDIGKELAAQKSLSTRIFSVEKQCVVASTLYDLREAASERSADFKGDCAMTGIVTALDAIAARLTRNTANTPPPSKADEEIGERVEEWSPGEQRASLIVTFSSEPEGAVVSIDGALVCQDTTKGCSRVVLAGAHSVVMEKEGYFRRSEELAFRQGEKVHWKLEPKFGWLEVTSEPAGLEVRVDGDLRGETPIKDLELPPGMHEVLVGDRCYFATGKRVLIAQGLRKEIAVAPKPRASAIDISSEDTRGNALEGEVWVDEARVGSAPGTFTVSVCAKKVEVRVSGFEPWFRDLALTEKQVSKLRAVLVSSTPEQPREGRKNSKNPVVRIQTSMGTIVAELFADDAPLSVRNFLRYVDSGFYDGTIFHRVISNFMIQGGGYDKNMVQKFTHQPIKNEASNRISNQPGTLSMARTTDPDSATSQFFINTVDNRRLDYTGAPGTTGAGYAVFGKVLSGMDVVLKIGGVRTRGSNGMNDVPAVPVVIESIRKLEN